VLGTGVVGGATDAHRSRVACAAAAPIRTTI